MGILQAASVFIELCVGLLGIILIVNRKSYGWFIALTFFIYVVYDISHFMSWEIPALLRQSLFLAASLFALIAVVIIYREGRKKS